MSFEKIKEFFQSRLDGADALLIDGVHDLGSQKFKAKVLKVYTQRFEGFDKYESGAIEFVGTPGSWGNPTLVEGEKAITFIRYIAESNRYYEYNWHAHLSIRKFRSIEYAIVKWNEENSIFWPDEWRDYVVFPDEAKPWVSGVPFEKVEKYLLESISGKS